VAITNSSSANIRDLLDNEVTAVELLGLEWGRLTSRERTGTARVYETWSTTGADTTSEQSRSGRV
jgi:hypothetical protein